MITSSVKLALCFVIAIAFATSANAGFLLGDTYFIAPGAGTTTGFQLAGGPFEDSIIDLAGELIGPDISGNGLIVSSDALIDNGGGNFDLILRLATTVGGNIMPTGIIGDSGAELTSVGLFVGAATNPVDLGLPVFAESAQIEVFNTANNSIGTIDVINMSNFTAGDDGSWDGTLGLDFANLIPIGDVGAIELQINFDAVGVPEPSSAIVTGLLLGLATIRRRR